MKDLITRKEDKTIERVGGIGDWSDRFIEGLVRRPGTLLWEEMKDDARDAFAIDGAGTDVLTWFSRQIEQNKRRIKLHLVGHSTGTVVIAYLLQTLRRRNIRFSTCALLAPACSVDLYQKAYLPVLQKKTAIRVDDLRVYNLNDALEREDNVEKVYRKSLLYLVSNAFERVDKRPLLGMEKFSQLVTRAGSQPQFIYSNGVDGAQSRSTSHGGFDTDVYTMNHVLEMILGAAPGEPFRQAELDY